MKVLKKEMKHCISCMEQHDVDIVEIEEKGTFKGELVSFSAVYEYCSNTEEYLETEEMMRKNSLAQKDAYRKAVRLLTSDEIKSIREKFGMGQKEFAEVLGWGAVTVARYETQQVQDRAHDDILRKIDSEPKWFLEMLDRAKDKVGLKYVQYYSIALLRKKMSPYICSFANPHYSYSNLSFTAANVNVGLSFNPSYDKKLAGEKQYCGSTHDIPPEISAAA